MNTLKNTRNVLNLIQNIQMLWIINTKIQRSQQQQQQQRLIQNKTKKETQYSQGGVGGGFESKDPVSCLEP